MNKLIAQSSKSNNLFLSYHVHQLRIRIFYFKYFSIKFYTDIVWYMYFVMLFLRILLHGKKLILKKYRKVRKLKNWELRKIRLKFGSVKSTEFFSYPQFPNYSVILQEYIFSVYVHECTVLIKSLVRSEFQ